MISKMTRIFWILILAMSAQAIEAKPVALDYVAVVVNNGVITEQQIQEQMNLIRKDLQQTHSSVPNDKILHQQAMNHLIDMELQRDMAKLMQIEVTDKQLDQAIEDIAKKNGATIAQLKEKIQEEGINYDKYRKIIHDQMLFGELQRKQLGGSINVSEQEVKDAIATNPNIGKSVSDYHVEDWLVPLPDNATPQQIAQAKQLALAVSENIKKSGNPNNPTVVRNDLGWRQLGGFPDVFATIIPRLSVGETSAPIQAGNGFHLLRILEVHGEQAQKIVETHARHILIKTNALTTDEQAKERLGDLLVKLNHGEDFAKIAQVNSQDLVSAANGGDLGWMTSDKLDPAFAGAMDKLKINEMSGPIKSQFGWHIIQVLGRRDVNSGKNAHYSLAREWVFHKKADEAIGNWLKQLRSQAYIKITDAKTV